MGDLTVSVRLANRHLSDLGDLPSWSLTANWTPVARVKITAKISEEKVAASLNQLGARQVTTPNSLIYDFVRGEAVRADILTGGNPDLLPETRNNFSAYASWKPFENQSLNLNLDYSDTQNRNRSGALPVLTAEIEEAFPGRVLRNAQGGLVRIDKRPINYQNTQDRQVSFGVDYSTPLTRSNSQGEAINAGDLYLSFNSRTRLESTILIREGLEALDLLAGASINPSVGLPRHEYDGEVKYTYKGLGFVGNFTWTGKNSITGTAGGIARSNLSFASSPRFGFRAYIDFRQRPNLTKALPLLRNTRVSLSVANVLDDITRVTDGNGMTPLSYQRAFQEPIGRTVELIIRKRF
jgi:iron complex outermembrane recepter protein